MKNRLFTLLFAFITVIMLAYVLSHEDTAAMGSGTVMSETETVYTLKDYNGKLAVFKDEAQIPYEIFDVFTSNLPKKDREAVKKGIKANGKEEITKIISDYVS